MKAPKGLFAGQLPKDVLRYCIIPRIAHPATLLRCRLVCKLFREWCSDDELWIVLYEEARRRVRRYTIQPCADLWAGEPAYRRYVKLALHSARPPDALDMVQIPLQLPELLPPIMAMHFGIERGPRVCTWKSLEYAIYKEVFPSLAAVVIDELDAALLCYVVDGGTLRDKDGAVASWRPLYESYMRIFRKPAP